MIVGNEAICKIIKTGLMPKQIINTENAPAPIGPYNQSVKAGGFLFLSGQIAIDPVSGELVNKNIKAETHQVMKNLAAVLEEAKLTFDHVVKTTIFLSEMSLFADVNTVYGSYFSGDYPARETIAVKALPKGAHVEISMVAVEIL
jgi:2-iminobutanoate/2-iminopropanoate deaminase